MKRIEMDVANCDRCPFIKYIEIIFDAPSTPHCGHEKLQSYEALPNTESITIPSWCPLPDADREKE